MASSVTDFSQPIYLDEAQSGTSTMQSGSPSSSSTTSFSSADDQLSGMSMDVIDLNDPNLLSAELDTNADVDAYAAPPPLPDGRYRVKIKQVDVKGPDGQPVRYNVKPGKNGAPPYAYTALQANVVDPGGKFDNQTLLDNFVSTMQNRNGGIPIVRILTVLGVKLPAKTNAKILLDLFFKALAGEPELEIDSVWEGGLDQTDRERFEQAQPPVKFRAVLGMHRFPLAANGVDRVPDLEVETTLGKVNVRARARINGYFPLGSGAAKK